ncbi:MAG: hypothetical protein BroJett040_16140 [Oligoflexia bacterium]|nr:MAG: hypothetical protein BroJett040_16140 [Oligoflexia bacterium]
MKTKTLIPAVLVAMFAVKSLATIELNQVPSVQLNEVVPGSGVQAVEDIPDKSKLSIFYNDLLIQADMKIPGWNSDQTLVPDEKDILDVFGVRTTANPMQIQPENSIFYSGKGVGRSGVWEKESAGDYFAIVNGKVLKGLTIKGYGGNAGKGQQPEGSLDAAEAYRDTLVSKVLMDKGVDTYIGAFTVVRPTVSSGPQANFVRLSRSSLRMNDLIDRNGIELRKVVDHLRFLIADEVGKVMTEQEFAQWLVERTAITLAGKEHARVKASNDNKDNLGIGELVDFGEAKYDPMGYKPGSDLTGGWGGGLRPHSIAAANNIAKEYGFAGDFGVVFDQVYQAKFKMLEEKDARRILIDKATVQEMKDIGLSDLTIKRIQNLKSQLRFGILALKDLDTVPMSSLERKLIRNRATTSLMKMANGHILSEVLIEEVGGMLGLRDAISRAVLASANENLFIQDKSKLDKAIVEAINEQMTVKGANRYQPRYNSGYGVNVVELLRMQISNEVMGRSFDFVYSAKLALLKQPAILCRKVF